jgi:hypothetical protein
MPLSSTDDVWHILDVTPNSPADLAGLLPYGDYVIGSPEALVRGESGLGDLVEHVGCHLLLTVNTEIHQCLAHLSSQHNLVKCNSDVITHTH